METSPGPVISSKIKKLAFGVADMRRTGAVSSGGTVESIAAKMGNSIDPNKTPEKTYMPVNLAAQTHRERSDAKTLPQNRMRSES
jgi:hypothetical protein